MTTTRKIQSTLLWRIAGVWIVASNLAPGLFAQSSPGSVYINAGVTSVREQGATNGLYLGPPGGFTHGLTLGAGVLVAQNASVELEMLNTGSLRSRQRPRTAGGRATYDEETRDRFISINFRVHASPWRRVQFNPLGGIAFVHHEAWSQLIATNDAPVIAPRERRSVPVDRGVMLGFDLRIGNERLSVVPSLRFWRRGGDIRSDREQYQHYEGGPSQWMLSSGAMARVDF